MDCLRPACVCVCAYGASAIPLKLRTHTYMHNQFSTYICRNPCTHIGMPTWTQTHSMLECGEFIKHTAHGPDVTALNSTVQHKKQQLPHKTSL